MRLDHLLSKENTLKDLLFIFQCTFNSTLFHIFGAVAQLARAPALQAGGQEFDSPQLHQVLFIRTIFKHIEKYIDEKIR